ncbi:helix-turn-helix domain-containing protein [Microbacterium sp.]|uniref:helix-turn-helix domain-containing protein n=1 Tax=Microbacterium sp. TaxID=51671 RepID=UPI0028117C4B|nr:helix-turn-helix domain-containing protein [Microbacterium sp.]
MDHSRLLIHPVRLRIVHALTGDRQLTVAELQHQLENVSAATVYRQVAALVDGGIVRVASERRVRGVVERSYSLTSDRPPVDAAAVAAASAGEHRRAFEIAMTTLLAEFEGYIRRADSSPASDLVVYQQMALWLSREQLEEFLTELTSLISRLRQNAPQAGRDRYLFSPIIFPTERGPSTDIGPPA